MKKFDIKKISWKKTAIIAAVILVVAWGLSEVFSLHASIVTVKYVADMETYQSDPNGGYTEVSVAMAEMTVARLVEGKRPMLTVRRKDDGNTVLSIPLIDYALLVKGYYNRDMSNQEYLDRQDEYNLTFFLDSNQRWIKSSIIVNSWKVVLSQENLK